MRVVAGTARGRQLRAPAGTATRPTSDRVREAIFSMLTSMDLVEGARVVDLFAGSGALGIEALSRGAESAVFVELDRSARAIVSTNLGVLSDPMNAQAEVVGADALRFASSMAAADLVFADPPYGYGLWPELLVALHPRTGTLVAETGAPFDLGPAWETVKVRKYGVTVITVAQPIPASFRRANY